jgi:type II secretory pathway pseudopilin PulG
VRTERDRQRKGLSPLPPVIAVCSSLRVQPSPHPPRAARAAGSSAFTLLELMLSTALMAMILATVALCLRAAVSGRTLIDARGDALQSARVAMSLLTADLRAAYPLSQDMEFIGMRRSLDGRDADNIDFATLNHWPRGPEESDVCAVSYFLDRDIQSGTFQLSRRRNAVPVVEPGADPLGGGTRETISEGIRGFRLEYYDGLDWYDEWGDPRGRRRSSDSLMAPANLAGMPEAVRITISVEPELRHQPDRLERPDPEPPLILQTVVRLNLAGIAAIGPAGTAESRREAEAQPAQPGVGM